MTPRLLRSALVIARRDYVATVFSRTFIFFLLGPLIAAVFGGLIGHAGSQSDDEASRPRLTVIAAGADAASIRDAHGRLTARLGDSLPILTIVTPPANPKALLAGGASAVLTGLPATPLLIGPKQRVDAIADEVRLILDEAATGRALAAARLTRPEPQLATHTLDAARGQDGAARHLLARAAQTLLFMLTLLLAGMLLSNLVEEKSNKVIEVLAAAVPVDGIFLGKLIAMLGVSLSAIALWGSLIAGLAAAFLPAGAPAPIPATGWPLFILLAIAYYVMNYMILGGIFLGLGAQASSVREVQTMSMPVTMAQLAIFALASAALPAPHAPIGLLAAILPVSSPLTMAARAALEPTLWPHLLALAWQALWVALIIRFAARRFRVGVLKSGAPKRSLLRRA